MLVFSLVLLALPAQAENAYAETVDWLVHDADLVVRGEVTRWTSREVEIEDPGVVRGSMEGTTITASVPERGCDEVSVQVGGDVVLFLREAEAGWVARCVQDRADGWILSLDAPEAAYTADGRVLKAGPALWAHVQSAAVRSVAGAPHPVSTPDERFLLHQGPMRIEVREGPAHAALYAGSAVYLGVPPYEDLRDDVMTRSRSERWNVRRRAARQLASYPGPETEERLQELLHDPHVSEFFAEGCRAHLGVSP